MQLRESTVGVHTLVENDSVRRCLIWCFLVTLNDLNCELRQITKIFVSVQLFVPHCGHILVGSGAQRWTTLPQKT